MVRQTKKGSGLGLVLCKEFIERHKVKIWVESEEGKGSDFKFMLPLNNPYA
jgi:signal transduction histidine kinase